jgi:hypothetical protein
MIVNRRYTISRRAMIPTTMSVMVCYLMFFRGLDFLANPYEKDHEREEAEGD